MLSAAGAALDCSTNSAASAPPPGSSRASLSDIITLQVAKAARILQLPDEMFAIFGPPKSEIVVNFPVKMDSGSYRLFHGYRVQHNDILGPYQGGLRYCLDLTLDDCRGLALAMSCRAALQGIPFGGSMGGIQFDPTQHSKAEIERITRRFCHALANFIGPEYDIFAPDLGTNGQTMAWLMDTYMNIVGALDKNSVRRVVTGKSVGCGGAPGQAAATAQGVVHCITEWAHTSHFDLTGKTVAIQGFGNVGSYAGKLLSKLGVSLVATGDEGGYIFNHEGINPYKLAEHVKKTGSVVDYKHGRPLSREAFFDFNCDILIPAARELQIREKEARCIRAKVIAEGANSPTYPVADDILAERGIFVLPDLLVNSGGVAASYYEWMLNKNAESWDEEEVFRRLESAMKRAYARVHDFSCERKVDLRTAAHAISLLFVQTAYADLGIWP